MRIWTTYIVLCSFLVNGTIDFGDKPEDCCVSGNETSSGHQCICAIGVRFKEPTKYKKKLAEKIMQFFEEDEDLSEYKDKVIILNITSVNETSHAILALNEISSFSTWLQEKLNSSINWSNNTMISNAMPDDNVKSWSLCPHTETWYLSDREAIECIAPKQRIDRGKAVDGWVIWFSVFVSVLAAVIVYVVTIYKFLQKTKEDLEIKNKEIKSRNRSDTELALLIHPSNTPFKQQTLEIWAPKLTTGWAMMILLVISMVMLPFGVIFLMSSSQIIYVEQRYDNLPQCAISAEVPTRICNITIEIPSTMEPPIYFYYKLGSFYQNYRRYVKSRSDAQISGNPFDEYTEKVAKKCEPASHFTQADLDAATNLNATANADLVGKILYPCGLVAQSMFTDSYINPCLQAPDQNICELLEGGNWNGTGIAWASDMDDMGRFKERELDERETDISLHGNKMPSIRDENFIVWMRTATLPDFTKLNRKIEKIQIPAGSVIELQVENSFPTYIWGGTKSVVLSTVSWMGGKNHFFGIGYLSVGILCFFLAVFVYFKSDV